MSEDKAQQTQSWVTEGLVLAASSVFAYLVTYAFEFGYSRTFRIPWGLVRADSTTVVGVTTGIVLSLLGLGVCATITVGEAKWDTIKTLLPRITWVLIPSLLLGAWLRNKWSEIDTELAPFLALMLFAMVAMPLYVGWIAPLIKYRGGETYIQKLKEHDEAITMAAAKRARSATTTKQFLVARLGRYASPEAFFVLLIFLLTLLWSCVMVGEYWAENEKQFLVGRDGNGKQWVLLRVYGETLICAPLAREGEQTKVEQKLVLIGAGDARGLEWRWEPIGPLGPWRRSVNSHQSTGGP